MQAKKNMTVFQVFRFRLKSIHKSRAFDVWNHFFTCFWSHLKNIEDTLCLIAIKSIRKIRFHNILVWFSGQKKHERIWSTWNWTLYEFLKENNYANRNFQYPGYSRIDVIKRHLCVSCSYDRCADPKKVIIQVGTEARSSCILTKVL